MVRKARCCRQPAHTMYDTRYVMSVLLKNCTVFRYLASFLEEALVRSQAGEIDLVQRQHHFSGVSQRLHLLMVFSPCCGAQTLLFLALDNLSCAGINPSRCNRGVCHQHLHQGCRSETTLSCCLLATTSTATCCIWLQIKGCIAIKGAEDSQVCAGKQHAFEISTQGTGPQYFIAPDGRVWDYIVCIVVALVSEHVYCSALRNLAGIMRFCRRKRTGSMR